MKNLNIIKNNVGHFLLVNIMALSGLTHIPPLHYYILYSSLYDRLM